MDKTKDAFVRYLELLGKVDAFTERARSSFPGQIACGPGCTDCCTNTFTIFSVEAHHIRLGYNTLPAGLKKSLSARAGTPGPNTPCPLLEDGLCVLYPFRPIICRTHGFPFSSAHIRLGGQSVTSFCEKNFTGMPDLSGMPREAVLNLDLLNSTLAAINHLFLKESGRSPKMPERVWLPDAFKKQKGNRPAS